MPMVPPAKCRKLSDIPRFFREQFEGGDTPCDEPPGFTELYYQKWVELGGKPTPPKPVTMDDL